MESKGKVAAAPATQKEAELPPGALNEILGEEGWMQKVKPAETPASGGQRWHLHMSDFAHTYLPTFFGPKVAATAVPDALEILQEKGWMEKAKPKEVEKKFDRADWRVQFNDAVHTYLPTFFGPKKETSRILPANAAPSVAPVAEPQAALETTPAPASATGGSALDEAAQTKGNIIPKEVKEEKIEAPVKPAAEAPAQEPTVPVSLKRHSGLATGGGLTALLAALAHVGIGHERMLFTESMATMLDAGLPLMDCLKTLEIEAHSRRMKKIIERIRTNVENGKPLWRSMEEEHLFTPHALALVRIGEEAGNLAKNMQLLAIQEEKDHQLKGKVQMAMIYPTIVCVLMFVIVMGLGIFVLPQLVGVLYSLNVPLPLVTRIVIMFSEVMSKHGSIVVPASIAGMALIFILAKFTPMRVVFQWILFKVPGVGRLAKEATIARFGVILGGLLQAGVPVVEALRSLVDVTPIVFYRKFYEKLLEHVTLGDSFSKSFSLIRGANRILPPSVQQLVMTGERSGALATIMLKIADIYDRKASETAQKLPIILEPMLLLVIGGLVGTIAFAIIVPIYSIVGSVGR